MVIAPWKYLGNADKYVNDDLSKQNALLTYVGTSFSFLDMCNWNLIPANREVQQHMLKTCFISKYNPGGLSLDS